ncbi:hypothetical protein NP493_1022g00008 [Ridgeia piscesae]|uniref:Uncharacterized protein n=1 Tax=Ridgeia piscesae TaxID=27915 RepID=A0AAD9KJS2_RIDPI|nr:hypothetical protein NP493_1022g00008 [Ridgeia piscesae]
MESFVAMTTTMLLLLAFFAAPPLVGSTVLGRLTNKQPLPMQNQLQDSYDKGPLNLAWITHLLQTSKVHSAAKKDSPSASKRNRGMWIWMPSKGYVSVPKQMQSSINKSVDKQAKIFRYGR